MAVMVAVGGEVASLHEAVRFPSRLAHPPRPRPPRPLAKARELKKACAPRQQPRRRHSAGPRSPTCGCPVASRTPTTFH